jgi:hypothetical protein
MPDLYTWIAGSIAVLALIVGVSIFGTVGTLVLIAISLLALATLGTATRARTRRANERRDPRFVPTDEVFRDPGRGELIRVHVDPATGERRYWKA